MDADGLKSMYLRWLTEMWGAGKFEVAAEIFTEDVRDHNAYPGQPPAGLARSGRRAWSARRSPDLAFTPDVVTSDGEFVTGRWTMTGTNTGTMELFGSRRPAGR